MHSMSNDRLEVPHGLDEFSSGCKWWECLEAALGGVQLDLRGDGVQRLLL